jgi:hypothetical protein
MQAQRRGGGMVTTHSQPGTRRRWAVSTTLRLLYFREKDPVPIVQDAVWAPRQVWTDAENLAPTGIQSPDRPFCSKSLYRLRYPGRQLQGYL